MVTERVDPSAWNSAAVLLPAVATAAHRVRADTVGLIGVGVSAGIVRTLDRVGVSYDNGQFLGDRSSPVQLTAKVVGGGVVPSYPSPGVVHRTLLTREPPDTPGGPDDVRSLLGDAVTLVGEAVAGVPDDALPVVTTAWSLSRFAPARRQGFLSRLQAASAARTLVWVSVEGVGVAPGVPTLGDRPASGHSTIGLTILDRRAPGAEALGRCWSRGRALAFL